MQYAVSLIAIALQDVVKCVNDVEDCPILGLNHTEFKITK